MYFTKYQIEDLINKALNYELISDLKIDEKKFNKYFFSYNNFNSEIKTFENGLKTNDYFIQSYQQYENELNNYHSHLYAEKIDPYLDLTIKKFKHTLSIILNENFQFSTKECAHFLYFIHEMSSQKNHYYENIKLAKNIRKILGTRNFIDIMNVFKNLSNEFYLNFNTPIILEYLNSIYQTKNKNHNELIQTLDFFSKLNTNGLTISDKVSIYNKISFFDEQLKTNYTEYIFSNILNNEPFQEALKKNQLKKLNKKLTKEIPINNTLVNKNKI